MNIYEKMSEATDKISKVAKNLNVGIGKAAYKAVGEADVLAAVKPIEKELGIYSYPVSREIVESEAYTQTTEYNGEKKEKLSLWLRVKTVYRFVNVEKPDEYVEITAYGDGVDPQDKAPGKAMTYADKYALLKAYKIETGEDPDQNASAPMRRSNKSTKTVTSNLIQEATNAGVNVEKLAIYLKKNVSELTADDIQKAINTKRGIVA